METVNKSDFLYLELRKKIAGMSHGDPFPTVRALISEFKVSQPTVEAALKKLKGQNLLCAHVGRGTFVCKPDSPRKKILLLQPDWPARAIVSMIEPFRHAAETQEFDFDVQTYDYRLKLLPLREIQGNPDLILLDSIGAGYISLQNLSVIAKYPVPVLISRTYVPVEGINCICNDNGAAGTFLANYLYRMGHRKIGVLLNEPGDSVSCEFLRRSFSFAASSLLCSIEYLDCGISFGERPDRKIREFARKIADGNYDFSALFAISNYGAAKMYEELRALGVRIPEDLSLLTNGDKPETPGVSTYDISYADYADAVMRLARKILREKNAAPRMIELDAGRFIDRGSVKKRNQTDK